MYIMLYYVIHYIMLYYIIWCNVMCTCPSSWSLSFSPSFAPVTSATLGPFAIESFHNLLPGYEYVLCIICMYCIYIYIYIHIYTWYDVICYAMLCYAMLWYEPAILKSLRGRGEGSGRTRGGVPPEGVESGMGVGWFWRASRHNTLLYSTILY